MRAKSTGVPVEEKPATTFAELRGVSHHDPGSMTAEERVREVGQIFAASYLRLLAKRARKGLESLSPESVDVNGSESDKEAA
jgi:hypothetical protein